MWDKIFTGVNIATMQVGAGSYGIIEDAAFGMIDGEITFVGKMADLTDTPENLAISHHQMDGEWVLPGFIDCHTHLVFGGNRAREYEMRLNGATYEELSKAGGGILSTVTATREATQAELVEASLPRLEALRDSGVTTVEIKSGYGLTLDDEIKMLKAAIELEAITGVSVITTLLAAHATPPEYKDNADAYIDHICAEIIPAALEAEVVDAVDAFCEGIAFTPDQVRRVLAYAKSEGLDVKLHADQLSDLGGAGIAAEYGALSADHIEYASAASVDAMADAGTVAVLLPAAFYNLKENKRPPVEMLRSKNVPIAIATDCNPGSSPATNIQLMLHMACTLFGLTPAEALRGITLNAAKALGIDETHGSLEVGKVADFNIIEMGHPSELAYWIGGTAPKEIYKDGEIL